MPFRIMTLQQAAARLHLEAHVVEQLVKRGEIPFTRRGEDAVFSRRELDAWASQRLLGMHPDATHAHHAASTRRFDPPGAPTPLVPRLFRAEWIEPCLLSKTKPAVMRDLVALAGRTEQLYDEAALLQGVLEREALCSTAIDAGVAFLHARYHDAHLCSDSFVILARTANPIFAGAADGQTTDLFFLLCCQDDTVHLHALARLCALAHATPLLVELRQAETAAEMFAALVRNETALLLSLR